MPPPDPSAVVYESEHTSLGWKLVVSVGTGVAVVGAVAFLRWFERCDDLGVDSPGSLTLGVGVALAMAAAALRSRVVRRVELRGDLLLLVRDPGQTERWPLGEIRLAKAEHPVGGWSREPADVLVLSARDHRTCRYTLPDDADTSGIANDINEALRRCDERAEPTAQST